MDDWKQLRNPLPTVDIILQDNSGQIALIQRKNPPMGWALPGGFVDAGESCETAAIREAKEELSVDVRLLKQFGVYSDPSRDARMHTISIVFIAEQLKSETIKGADDALVAKWFDVDSLPWNALCFDHRQIIEDFLAWTDGCPTCGKE